MYLWDSWDEDDDGNTFETGGDGVEQPCSVTDATDSELSDFAGWNCGDGVIEVSRDFDGRAYIACNGARVAVVESTLLCDGCGALEPDWAQDGDAFTCGACLESEVA